MWDLRLVGESPCPFWGPLSSSWQRLTRYKKNAQSWCPSFCSPPLKSPICLSKQFLRTLWKIHFLHIFYVVRTHASVKQKSQEWQHIEFFISQPLDMGMFKWIVALTSHQKQSTLGMKNKTGFQEGRESGMVVPEGMTRFEGVGKELQWKLETSKANSLLSRLTENYIDSGKRISGF